MLVDDNATPIKVDRRFAIEERIVAQYSLSIAGGLVFLPTLEECHFPQFLLHALWHRLNCIQTLRQYGKSIKQHFSVFAIAMLPVLVSAIALWSGAVALILSS